MSREFKFDPNSTVNQGRWRLRNPLDYVEGSYRTIKKNDEGISYIIGLEKNSEKISVQAIRFDLNIWTEKDAALWWKKNKRNYEQKWTEKDWLKANIDRIPRQKAFSISKSIAKVLNVKYVDPLEVDIDTKFEKNIALPVGSLRHSITKEPRDIDLIITKQIYKKDLVNIKQIEDISGGEKRIDFKWSYMRNKKKTYINVNLFIYLEKKTWGAALLHSTGPFYYNIRLRHKVKGYKYMLSQNGLFDENGNLIPTPTERILLKKINATERTPLQRGV